MFNIGVIRLVSHPSEESLIFMLDGGYHLNLIEINIAFHGHQDVGNVLLYIQEDAY